MGGTLLTDLTGGSMGLREQQRQRESVTTGRRSADGETENPSKAGARRRGLGFQPVADSAESASEWAQTQGGCISITD